MTDCVPYPPDMSCAPDWDMLDPAVAERSIVLAWSTIRLLTAGKVGSCETVLRPCVAPCNQCQDVYADGYRLYRTSQTITYRPPCRTASCSCTPISEVMFPGHVAEVLEVWLDGLPMPTDSYRLYDRRRLVRIDGDIWPSCQDLTLDETEMNTFSVHYIPGIPPGSGGLWAAGILALEFSKACLDGKCRLPSSVTSIVRQGVTMQFDNSMFSNGLTGIREVDAWILSINPHKHKIPPRVWSPDTSTGTFDEVVSP